MYEVYRNMRKPKKDHTNLIRLGELIAAEHISFTNTYKLKITKETF